MSYTALSLVNNDDDALHNSDTLANVSSAVFSIFFKHFVQAGSNDHREGMYMNGSWGLQPHGAVIPSDLGPILSSSTYLQKSSTYLQKSFLPSNTSATVNGVITTQIEQLDLNPAAVILSLFILCFLLLTTMIVLGWHRQHLRLLPRDVDTIGSVLGFVYASERLLALARHQDETEMTGKESGNGEMVKMGWFESGGKRRWGVEIIDELRGDYDITVRNRKQGPYVQVDLHEGVGP